MKTDIKFIKRQGSGFTLLELLVVVGILAALVALALPFYQDYVNQSKLTAAQADLQTFKKALAMYDQLEPNAFVGTDLLKLIGKYLQDYRTFTGQTKPVDSWGNDYVLQTDEGVIKSLGPNGTNDDATNKRVAMGDDILVTWKPPFFVSSARAVNQNTIEVTFSRKIAVLSGLASTKFSVTCSPAVATTVTGNFQKVSDTVYRFALTTNMIKTPVTTYTVTVGAVTAQDGKAAFDANPDGTDATGSKATFVY